ncbi:Actin-6 [Galdieria sulphuraria]|nr:Actin-6 [Galdieria sulphuraria]
MPIVVDCGANTCKVGFVNEDQPCAIFEPFVSQAKPRRELLNSSNACYVGNQLSRRRDVFPLASSPIQNGIIQDWHAMEEIFKYIFFDELDVDPLHQTVILSEPSLNPLKQRERMVEMLFEVFHIPALYIASQSMLALYSSGKTTGIVVDSGDSMTSVVPIYEGYTVQNGIQQQDISGKHLEQYLARLLWKKGYRFGLHHRENDIIRTMKENSCYIALDYQKEMEHFKQGKLKGKCFQLPDDSQITLDIECFQCPEMLFHPQLVGIQSYGLIDMVCKCIQEIPYNIRKDLWNNIVLSGGSMMITGIQDRLKKDLKNNIPSTAAFHIFRLPDARLSTWLGGSILGNLPSFEKICMTLEEYHELGAAMIHERCF